MGAALSLHAVAVTHPYARRETRNRVLGLGESRSVEFPLSVGESEITIIARKR